MSNIIGWLVPRPNNNAATQTTLLAENTSRTVLVSSSSYLSSQLELSAPSHAIQLTFDNAPKRHGRFVLGTNSKVCDVVLPQLPGVAAQHCSLGFDAQARLTIDDFSETGTQVWYGWDCIGDRTNYSWVLDSKAPQYIDIQGIRFQVILNEQPDLVAFKKNVETIYQPPRCIEPLSPTKSWSSPLFTCFTAIPARQRVVVSAETYVWDLERPWEPMVKAA